MNQPYKLNLFSCLGIVIGSIIGSGIFIVPAIMIRILPSPQLIFLVWVLSAFVSITGGLVISGIGAAYPHARDLLDYYRVLFPKWISWFFNVIANWFINGCGTVAIIFVFAEYFSYFVPLDKTGIKLVAIALLALLTLVNSYNMKAADRFQLFFTGIKVGAVLLLIGLLLIPGKGSMDHFGMSTVGDWNTLKIAGAFIAACTGALNAFDGWYMISHLTNEVEGGAKTVGRSIVLGILICMGLYLLTTFAYQYVLTPSEIASSNLVAVTALEKVVGGWGAALITVMVLISASSGANAALIASSRLMASTATQKMLPYFLGHRNKKNIPVNAFLLMFVYQTILIISGSYELFLDMTLFSVWLFVTILTAGFLHVFIKNKLALPGFRRIPMIISCILLILFGIVYLGNMLAGS